MAFIDPSPAGTNYVQRDPTHPMPCDMGEIVDTGLHFGMEMGLEISAGNNHIWR
jgi:hypothetical protein